MLLINTEPKYYPKNEAKRIVVELTNADPGWQYKVVDFIDSGYSMIKVIDEEGIFVGYWN